MKRRWIKLIFFSDPDLWFRIGVYMKEKHPEVAGVPSKNIVINLLLQDLGF